MIHWHGRGELLLHTFQSMLWLGCDILRYPSYTVRQLLYSKDRPHSPIPTLMIIIIAITTATIRMYKGQRKRKRRFYILYRYLYLYLYILLYYTIHMLDHIHIRLLTKKRVITPLINPLSPNTGVYPPFFAGSVERQLWHMAPFSGFTLTCHILVSIFILGGLSGYSGTCLRSTSIWNVPSTYNCWKGIDGQIDDNKNNNKIIIIKEMKKMIEDSDRRY